MTNDKKAPQATRIRIDIDGERPSTRKAEELRDDLNTHLRQAVELVLNAGSDGVFDWDEIDVSEVKSGEYTQLQAKLDRARQFAGHIIQVCDDEEVHETNTLFLDGVELAKATKPIRPNDVEPTCAETKSGLVYSVTLPAEIKTHKDRKHCAVSCGGYKHRRTMKANSPMFCGYFQCVLYGKQGSAKRCPDCLHRTGDD